MTLTAIHQELTRLEFFSCKDEKCKDEELSAETYSVMASAQVQVDPERYSFEFMIGATGENGEVIDVEAEIKKIRELFFQFNGTIHQPSPVKIKYGTMMLKCVCYKFDVQYKQFNADGKVLIATVLPKFAKYPEKKPVRS